MPLRIEIGWQSPFFSGDKPDWPWCWCADISVGSGESASHFRVVLFGLYISGFCIFDLERMAKHHDR